MEIKKAPLKRPTEKYTHLEYNTFLCCAQEEMEGEEMVSASVHLYNLDDFKIYINKFADEYILTIETHQGSVNFMSHSLKNLEEITKKMWTEVKYETLLPKREEAIL